MSADKDITTANLSRSESLLSCNDSDSSENEMLEQAAHMREVREGVNMPVIRVRSRLRLNDIFPNDRLMASQDECPYKTA